MFRLLSKMHYSALSLFTLLSLSTMSSVNADECFEDCSCNSNRMYVGAFGGGLYSEKSRVTQMGTAYFLEAEGGPLSVLAEGRTKKSSTGFGGVQLGYEMNKPFGCSGWNIGSALELEGYWYKHTKKGILSNELDLNRLPEHVFSDSFQLNSGVYLANFVLSLGNQCLCGFTPYVGVGVGATRISIKKANSSQIDPEEFGVNHFNSKPHDSNWAFAAQAKAGLRYTIFNSIHLFGEYRYLFIDSSNYIFGATSYPEHAHTSPWNVKISNIQYNAFAFGVQFDL